MLFGGGVENASVVSLFKKTFLLYFGGGSSQLHGGGEISPLKGPPGNPDLYFISSFIKLRPVKSVKYIFQ